jgi:hypothetical protein
MDNLVLALCPGILQRHKFDLAPVFLIEKLKLDFRQEFDIPAWV